PNVELAMLAGHAVLWALPSPLSPPRPRPAVALRAFGDAANRARRLRATGAVRSLERRAELPAEAEALDAVGVALLAQQKPVDAEEAFRRALNLRGRGAPWALNNLAVALKSQGPTRYGEAEQLYREAINYREAQNPEMLTSLNNLAVLLKLEGQLPEAEQLYRQALFGRRRLLGNDHPDTLTHPAMGGSRSINNLATLLATVGQTEQAEELYREALEGCRRRLGEDDLDTLFSADSLGALLFGAGRAEEAEPLFRWAAGGLAKRLGAKDKETLRSQDNLAVALMAMQRLEEAEPLLRKAVAGFREALGADATDTLLAEANLLALMEEKQERDTQMGRSTA
ncbi:unnamed protein product, partial [Effrenium voratum]